MIFLTTENTEHTELFLTQRHKGTEFFDRINRIYRIHFLTTEYTKYTEQNHFQCIRCIPWFIIYPSDAE